MKRGFGSPNVGMSISIPTAVKSFTNANFGYKNLGSPNVNSGVNLPASIPAWSQDGFNASRPVTTAINGLGCAESPIWEYFERATLVLTFVWIAKNIYNEYKK